MSEYPQSGALLKRVAARLYVARVAWISAWAMLGFAALYAILLGVSRFTGAIENVFTPATLLAIPGLGLAVGLLWCRFPKVDEAAHQVDSSYDTHDLFLTLSLLSNSAGEYQPIVARDAETKAGSVDPARVVPLDVAASKSRQRLFSLNVAAVAALLGAIYFLPQLDPFGKVAEAKEQESQAKALQEQKKATEVRKAQLAEKQIDSENSEEVATAVKGLLNDFKQMKKGERKPNADKLNADQKALGEKFRGLANQLKELMSKDGLEQNFNMGETSELRKFEKELQEGATESLAKAIQDVKEDLERLSKIEDPVERSAEMRKMQKRLSELADFAGEKAGAKQLAAALERALDQMESMKSDKLSTEGLEAALESLEVSQMELKEVGQSARDLKKLEEALKAIAMAKQLNGEDKLDGEAAQGMQTLADYEALYEELMAQAQDMGEGNEGDEGEGTSDGEDSGEGTGGRGMGKGGKPPEDDSQKTDFTPEQSKSAVKKGKVLLSLKTKGLSENGDVKQQYKEAIRQVQQAYEEAIEEEQVPPGYHDGIKKYFDTLDRVDPALQDTPPKTE